MFKDYREEEREVGRIPRCVEEKTVHHGGS